MDTPCEQSPIAETQSGQQRLRDFMNELCDALPFKVVRQGKELFHVVDEHDHVRSAYLPVTDPAIDAYRNRQKRGLMRLQQAYPGLFKNTNVDSLIDDSTKYPCVLLI